MHAAMSDSWQSHGLAHQPPLSMGFFRQEYWTGLPFPPSRDLPAQGSPALGGRFSLPLGHQGSLELSLDDLAK